MRRRTKTQRHSRPEWANRLEGLRETLGLSQAALAKRLNVSAMAPSRWERGVHEPPAAVFLELGKLAGKKECWYFWERAGLTRRDVSAVLERPALQRGKHKIVSVDIPANAQSKAEKLVAVPVYAATLPVGQVGPSQILRETPTQLVVVPRSWCPNPDATYCMSMATNRMAPMLRRDTLFAVDPTETDIEQLLGKVVFASHEDCGLTVSWLQRFGRSTVLVPENKDEQPYYMNGDEWKIEGRVLWWFSKGP
jgi:transcriptional regulator with XRE-family HTH domain